MFRLLFVVHRVLNEETSLTEVNYVQITDDVIKKQPS